MNQLFYFTKKERRATILLAALILISTSIQTLLPDTDHSLEYDLSVIMAAVDSARALEKENSEIGDVKPFDINLVTSQELQDLGLKFFVADRWVKYREARRGFESMGDVMSIYGLDTLWFNEYKQYMSIQQPPKERSRSQKAMRTSLVQSETSKPTRTSVIQKESGIADTTKIVSEDRSPSHKVARPDRLGSVEADLEIDVNSANEWQWQMLHGIGPYYAKRIVSFRDKLGGFYSIDQVGDTYGLTDSTFQTIRPFLKIITPLSQFNINNISADSLSRHPYISHKQANILFRYRQQHGNYSSVDDFYKAKVFDSVFVRRIEPYILF